MTDGGMTLTSLAGYRKDIKLEECFADTIKAILGRQFISQDVNADIHEGTDFAIFAIKPFRVAARLRRFEYWGKYSKEFTLRWSRPNGMPTEIDKVRAGFVNYLFYGFVDKEEQELIQYFIGDFAVFLSSKVKPYTIKPNMPHDSDLAIYRIQALPSNFILRFRVKRGIAV